MLRASLKLCLWMLLVVSVRSELPKCCSKGDHLDNEGNQCKGQNGGNGVDSKYHEPLSEAKKNDPKGLYWVPPGVLNYVTDDTEIMYEQLQFLDSYHSLKRIYLNGSNTKQYTISSNFIHVNFPFPSSISRNYFHWTEYCMDFTDGDRGPFVIILETCFGSQCIDKCCPKGYALSTRNNGIKCEKNEKKDWSPETSLLLKGVSLDMVWVRDTAYVRCAPGGFKILEEEDEATIVTMVMNSPTMFSGLSSVWWQTCVDLEAGSDLEVVAYCEISRVSAAVASVLRWLCLPSAAMLLAAVVSVLARRELRCSAHGAALFWHTFCLLLEYAFQTVALWTYELCALWEVFISFFSMVAAFWLNIICLNLALGFKKSMSNGAQPSMRSDSVVERNCSFRYYCFCCRCCGWWLGTCWCCYGWIVPLAIFFCVRVVLNVYTFEESTICSVRTVQRDKSSFLGYFSPIIILISMNVVLFFYTFCKIRHMTRGNSILGRENKGNVSTSKNRMLVYVKLLLLTGVVEMIADVVAWASNEDVYVYRARGSVIDFARAVSVFAVCCCQRRVRTRALTFVCACTSRFAECCRRCWSRVICGTRDINELEEIEMQ